MELERLSGARLGELINTRQISPVEVIEYFTKRIEERNPSVNAFTYLKTEEALKEARALEECIMRDGYAGPLAGVPFALKDFLPSKKGWTNSHGGVRSLIRTDTEDSEFCKAAEGAGAIAIGKTNAPAFAFRGTCDNRLYGPTSTPFNTLYNSGGSSGGSAAAVADGLVFMAQGTDGGGSIRIPASWCNCFGFKASVGTVPSICRPDAWTATHPYCFDGPITRTVEDAAIIFSYMAHYDPRDPLSLDHGHKDFTELMKKSLKGVKIAYTPDFGVFGTDREVERIVRKAALSFSEAGAAVDEDVPFDLGSDWKTLAEMWCRSISIDTSIDLELWKREGLDLIRDHRDELPEEFIYWNEVAFNSTVMDYRNFNEIRTGILDAFEDVFEKYDLILSPVTICPPVLNASDGNTRGPLMMNGQKVEPLIGFCETFPVNFSGHPASSVPAGLTAGGLPVGMQIIGRKFKDEDVFAASYTYEQIRPWSYDIPFNRKIPE